MIFIMKLLFISLFYLYPQITCSGQVSCTSSQPPLSPQFMSHWGAWFLLHCWPNSPILDVWYFLRQYLSICLVTWHRRQRFRAPLTFKTLSSKALSYRKWSKKSVNKSSWRKATKQRSSWGHQSDLFALWTTNED